MKNKKLWVYEFYIYANGEEPEVLISVEEVNIIGGSRWNDECVYYEVQGEHKGVTVSQLETVVSTDNKRIKKVWLEKRNDRLARTILHNYFEELLDFYDRRSEYLKEVWSIARGTKVTLINKE